MTSSAFLFALQLGDSALPTGRLSHSYGLEEFLAREPKLEEAALAEVVQSMLVEIVAPLDGVALAKAHGLAAPGNLDGLLALDGAVTARKITPASRHSSAACGRRLAALAPSLTVDRTTALLAGQIQAGRADGNLAVVEGVLASALGIGLEEAVLLELRGTSGALVSAALRLGRISATRAQVLAASLVPTLCDALEVALSLPVEDMRAVGPELDIAAMRHGRREGRLFAT
jgi:urease accessory protein